MEKMINQEDFLNNLFSLLDETFDNTHGHYLDKDTSLFRTLETVSAQEASIPVGGKCASLRGTGGACNFLYGGARTCCDSQ
jgi:hypothetical protein